MAIDFSTYVLKYNNIKTGTLIGNGYIFNGPIAPLISVFNDGNEIPLVQDNPFTITYTLEKDGEVFELPTGTFDNTGVTISDVGVYKLSTTLTDKSLGTNTKIFVLNFTINVSFTILESYNPSIINLQDFNSSTETYTVITNNSEIKGGEDTEGNIQGATPALDGAIPADLEVSSYDVTRNGISINYDPDIDILSDPGIYTVIITVSRKSGYPTSGGNTSKKFKVTFKVTQPPLDLSKVSLRIINKIDNREISQGISFTENNTVYGDIEVIPFYDLPERVDSSYTLFFYENITSGNVVDLSTIEGVELGDYELGATILSTYGMYILRITLIENQNEKNTFTFERKFFIERPQINIDKNYIKFRNTKTNNIIMDRDVFIASDQCTPLAYYDSLGIYGNEDIIKESFILTRSELEENSLSIKPNGQTVTIDNFINGQTECTEVGFYTLTYKITNTILEKVSEAYKPVSMTKEFIVKRSPVDLTGVSLSLRNNGDELINGYIYGPSEITNLTVDNILNTYISIQCRIKNITGDIKYKTIKTKDSETLLYNSFPIDELYGEYLITIECRDKEFPTINYITKTYVISVLKEQIDPSDKMEPSIRLYLNGQLQPITTKQFTLAELVGDIGNGVPKPGNYNLLVVNTNFDKETEKLFNFNYSVKEYNFRVVPTSTSQNPYVAFDPPKESGVKKSILKVYVKFPSYASDKIVALCKAGESPENASTNLWSVLAETRGYIEIDPSIQQITPETTSYIKVSYIDNTNGSKIVEDSESDRVEDYIDFDLEELKPENILLGLVDGEKYFNVTPNVKQEYNYSYICKVVGPSSNSSSLVINDETPEFELGNCIKNENGGWYALQIYRTNLSTGKVKQFEKPVVFYIDSSKPDKPILIDKSTNTKLKTDVYSSLTVKISNYNSNYSYRGYLNNRLILPVNGVFPIIKNTGNYKLTVIVEKKISSTGELSGSKNSTVANFIIDKKVVSTSDPILKNRQALIPLSSDKIANAYDGELISIKDSNGKYNGEFGLYRDGLIINRLSELGEEINRLDNDIMNLTIDARNNISNSLSLDFLSSELVNKLDTIREANKDTSIIVNKIYNSCQDLEVPKLSDIINKSTEINSILSAARLNTTTVNNFVRKLDGKVSDLKSIINSMQNNASLIAEVKQLYTNYKARIE